MNYLWEAIMWEGNDTHKELHGQQMHANTHTHAKDEQVCSFTYTDTRMLKMLVMHVSCSSAYTR